MNWELSTDSGSNWVTFASLNLNHAVRHLVVNGLDTFTFRGPAALALTADFPTGFTYGSTIIIRKNDGATNPIWFYGRLDLAPRSGSGPEESIQYRLNGPWWYLQSCAYMQSWKVFDTGGHVLVNANKTRVVLCQNSAGNLIDSGAQITDAIDWAISRGALITKGTIDSGCNLPFDERMNISCAEVIMSMLRYTPDVVAWFDYTTTPYPTFHCRKRSNLSAVSSAITALSDLDPITPRYDLQIPGITLQYEKTNSYDNNTWNTVETDTAGTTSAINSIFLSFELAGSTASSLTQDLTVEAVPVSLNDKAFWKSKIDWLNSILDADLTIESGTIGAASDPTLNEILIEGTIQDWMDVDYEDQLWSCLVSYKTKSLTDSSEIKKTKKELVTWQCVACNGATKTYRTLAAYDNGEATPTGLAAQIYASWNVLHYEGSLKHVATEVPGTLIPGTKLNLTSGRTEWASMASLIVETIEDIDSGKTTVSFGPLARLEVDALVGLFRALRARRAAWSRTARTTGAAGSTSDIALDGPVPKDKVTKGTSETEKLVIRATDGEDDLQTLNNDPISVTFADPADQAALTLQPREVLIPELVSGVYVLKRRQVLASESYHAVVEVGLGVPPYDFQFRPTSATAADIEWGHVYVDGLITSVDNWTNYDTLANLTLSSITTSIGYYIEVDLTEGSAALISTAGDFPDGDSTTEVFPLVRITCADGVVVSWKQHQWGVIHARTSGSGSGGNLHAFKFTSTSSTGGTLEAGSLYLAGVAKTITSLPSTLSSVTSTTRYYIEVDLAAATATWTSTTSAFPASDGDTEIWPILTLTCADSVISTVKQHQTSDIHIPSNV